MLCSSRRAARRPGITLTEILIAIFIMAIGLISLATLFPIGLIRLRDASRFSRSAYLAESAASDIVSRGLLTSQSFIYADVLNYNASNPYWYYTYNFTTNTGSQRFDPFIQDTPYYGGDWFGNGSSTLGAYAGSGGAIVGHASAAANTVTSLVKAVPIPLQPINGPGLPFAYDPLWRAQTSTYLDPNGQTTPEARFACGDAWSIRPDPDGLASGPSAHGLQRLSNFPVVMPASAYVPSIFVSPEDVVWQEASNSQYPVVDTSNLVGPAPSTVIPDLTLSSFPVTVGTNTIKIPQTAEDWRYSWMFTGQLTNATNEACFDGNIVIFEGRQFGINASSVTSYQVDGEMVVEAVFGYSTNTNISTNNTSGNTNITIAEGYGIGADRTVLLRWPASLVDPVVKVGNWIADVTYERNQGVVQSRWWQNYTIAGTLNGNPVNYPYPFGVPNPNNNAEWDNLPAQRCIWYQVQKVTPVETATGSMVFSTDIGTYRYMLVSVNQPLQARTLLKTGTNGAEPVMVNAALICPTVINVIPKTIFIR